MVEQDLQAFNDLLDGVCEVYGKDIGPNAVKVWFAALSSYGLADVSRALSAHVQDADRGRFMPKPADVIAQIEIAAPDGRPGPDEAWAMLPASEAESCVWTDEMSQAWGIAAELLPDRVAARMAFKDAYVRLCQKAKTDGLPVRWTPSLGTDKHGREAAIADAEIKGRLLLTNEQRERLLPAPEQSLNTTAAALIEHAPDQTKAKRVIAELREALQ